MGWSEYRWEPSVTLSIFYFTDFTTQQAFPQKRGGTTRRLGRGNANCKSLFRVGGSLCRGWQSCFVWKLGINSIETTPRLIPWLLSVHLPAAVIPEIPRWNGRNEPPRLSSPRLRRSQLLPERSHQSNNSGFCGASVGWEPWTQPGETDAFGQGQRELSAGSTQEWVSRRPRVSGDREESRTSHRRRDLSRDHLPRI